MLLLALLACAAPSGPPSKGGDEAASPATDSAPPADDSIPPTGDSPGPADSGGPPDSGSDDTDTPAPVLWRSALYPLDWTPDFTTEDGLFLHDFSYAGYHAGEVDLPSPPGPRFDATLSGADPTGATDSTAGIQAAITAASAAAPAVVYLPAGTYRVDGLLSVTTSGVVLQGDGSGSTFVYFTQTEGMDYRAHLTFSGSVSVGADHLLLADASSRDTTVTLSDTADFAVGDTVHVGWVITDDFVAAHGMTGVWTSFNGQWRTFFRRTVAGVDAGSLQLDVPLRYDALLRDGASVRKASGYLTECGIVGLSLSNVNEWDVAWSHTQVHVALLSGVQDCYVSDLRSWESPLSTDGLGKHLMSSGLEVLDSRRVTITGTTLEASQHRGDGGNGYLFEISRSNEILTVDSAARAGRHNFIQNWDFGTSGCVWLRTSSDEGRALLGDWDTYGLLGYSEYHHSLAMANLVDQSSASDGWQGVNRQTESSGAGHSATQSVWWNLSGGGYLRSLQVGQGYIIGTTDLDVHTDPTEWDWNDAGEGTEPEDWSEGLDQGATLDPPSLYVDQLLRRTGRAG